MNIQVKIKNVYGNETVYPVCDKAKLLASLAGHTTLTDRDLRLVKELGYTVQVVQEKQTL